ncbi:MarR family winged helix-turn-helix transcriptional regulator [Listeria kieliensis]|uniref:HTH marR-type domain-containing protein n=1 Tax=Listeria kieliensis TaxID=1621700 RepID=A0A3D8TTH1_9LIST|nr:MarR family transcriptional regulator [Listeria kieliensis]RDX02089.1 hypothetical protein UR08_00685 [Listeria kieliensis]
MTNLNLRDIPTRQLLKKYQKSFPELDIDSVLLYLDLQKVFRKTEQIFNSVFDESNLTEAKFIVLMLLYREPQHKLFSSELAEKSGVKRATITGVIAGLEKNNWVFKVPDDSDKRSTWICLTEEGKKHLEGFLPTNYQTAHQIMSALNKTDKDHLTKILKKISIASSSLRKDV